MATPTSLWLPRAIAFSVFATAVCFSYLVQAQEKDQTEKKVELPVIVDEPLAVDPATLVPEPLAAKKTADLKGKTLSEVADWLESECKVEVLIDKAAVSDVGILATDPVGEQLSDTPVYLFLDRLRGIKIGWYYSKNILHVTSIDKVEQRLVMVPYNVGDLLDAGFKMDDLADAIQTSIETGSWESEGGAGVLDTIGDVLFVRQNDEVHRKLRGLLQALRKHGRRTFIYDPPQHQLIRQRLQETIDVSFDDIALVDAVSQIAKASKIDIRLNLAALRALGIRDRTPVSLALQKTEADTVLKALLQDLQLTWILRDGVLWITSEEEASSYLITAVFDVRDLCTDDNESFALQQAIQSQTCEDWADCGGPGTMSAPKAGTLVIHNREELLNEVLKLLEAYRVALKGSKPRVMKGQDPNEVTTVYYRLQTDVALGLQVLLPKLVRPETWNSMENPKAPGKILMTASKAVVTEAQSSKKPSKAGSDEAAAWLVPHSVLIITQTRSCHDEIADVINRVQDGDAQAISGMGPGDATMGGFGGGGGFF